VRYPRLPSAFLLSLLFHQALAGSSPAGATESPACGAQDGRCPEAGRRCADPGCGRGADLCLTQRRERQGEEGEWIFRSYSFDRFLGLNQVSTPRNEQRARIDPATLGQIELLEEHSGAMLEGYLVGVRRIKRARKTCSDVARGTKRLETLEILIASAPGAPRSLAIRAEVTPGIRLRHPSWTYERLKHWTAKGRSDAPRIRIRGYLLYNNVRGGEVGAGRRPTAWEIAPVTEVFFCPSDWKCGPSDAEGWLELETL
jgi:hypothetical protein